MTRSGIIVGFIVLLAIATSKPVRADMSEAVYTDAKEIIQELLTAEVAQSAVPELVCRAGRRTEVVPEGAIQHQEAYPPLPAGGWYRPLATIHFPRTLQRFYARQFVAVRSALKEEVASFAAYVVYQGLDNASQASAGQMTLVDKFAGRDPARVPEAWFSRLVAEDHKKCVKEVKTQFASGKFQSSPESPLDEICRGASDADKKMRCEISLSIRDGLLGNKSAVEERIIRVIGLLISQKLGTNLEAAAVDAVVLATRLVLKEPFSADPVDTLNVAEARLRQAFIESGISGEVIDSAMKNTREWLSRLRTQYLLSSSAELMHLGTLVNVLAAPDGALAAVCPDNDGNRTCGVLKAAKEVLATTAKLGPLIRAAGRGDVREAGHLGVQTIFAAAPLKGCADPPTDHCAEQAQIEMYRRFADAVVLYVFDVVENGEPSAAATEAFRTAAVDVVLSVRGPTGFDRGFWGSFLAPGLGLRASWNAAYGTASGDSLRYVASVNWLTAKVRISYTTMTYSALHFSLVDPLAPLSELALRPQEDTSYRNNERLGWNVITPRAEIVFGFPTFSRHLAVGAGASLRIVAPLPVDEVGEQAEDNVEVFDYKYFPVRHEPFGESEWPRFVEFGFFVKYVM